MRLLLTLDERNYTEEMPAYERFNVRGVIWKGNQLAMVRSSQGEYKFPGGGVDPGEHRSEALVREIREETGLQVVPESIQELGEILEKREDLFCKGQRYICHSLFFACQVTPEMVAPSPTDSEVQQGFTLAWADPQEILQGNAHFLGKQWIARDTVFLKMMLEGMQKGSFLLKEPVHSH
jgi:8-oxo-dGTP pyrophosphatase MutT (NUDIX family)